VVLEDVLEYGMIVLEYGLINRSADRFSRVWKLSPEYRQIYLSIDLCTFSSIDVPRY